MIGPRTRHRGREPPRPWPTSINTRDNTCILAKTRCARLVLAVAAASDEIQPKLAAGARTRTRDRAALIFLLRVGLHCKRGCTVAAALPRRARQLQVSPGQRKAARCAASGLHPCELCDCATQPRCSRGSAWRRGGVAARAALQRRLSRAPFCGSPVRPPVLPMAFAVKVFQCTLGVESEALALNSDWPRAG